MWFLISDEEFTGFGDTPKEAYETFAEIHGYYPSEDIQFFKAEEKNVKIKVVIEEN